jgi:hypothetical protein
MEAAPGLFDDFIHGLGCFALPFRSIMASAASNAMITITTRSC